MAPTRRVTASGAVLHLTGAADARAGVAPAISNARLAMMAFLAFETMFFVALIGAYLVFRLSAAVWPPADLPRLPITVTWINTAVLTLSAVYMARALRALRGGQRAGLERALLRAALLGGTFLAVQGTEWVRLVRHGLTISAGTYGATFYTLIGCHGLHVLAAVVWLLVVMVRVQGHRFTGPIRVPLEICGIYWFFVVALWAALFPLVYLL